MTFNTYGNLENQSLLLIPGLGVSYGYKDVYSHKLESIQGADIPSKSSL